MKSAGTTQHTWQPECRRRRAVVLAGHRARTHKPTVCEAFARRLSGEERVIPLEELKAPAVALRVDGLDAGDRDYPLVYSVRGRIREGEGGEKPSGKRAERLRASAAALEELLAKKAAPLIENPSCSPKAASG